MSQSACETKSSGQGMPTPQAESIPPDRYLEEARKEPVIQ